MYVASTTEYAVLVVPRQLAFEQATILVSGWEELGVGHKLRGKKLVFCEKVGRKEFRKGVSVL